MKFIKLLIILLAPGLSVFAQNGTKTPATAASAPAAQPAPTPPPPPPPSAQYPLPAMAITTEQAQNNLTWYCQYDGIKSIAVQRSADSVRNFTTIGVINAPKKGMGAYRDTHPVVGKNYYRLSIEFGGDLEWFSNTYKVFLDSATIARSLEERIKTGTTNAITAPTNDKGKGETTESSTPKAFYFTPSSKIYTNPYTGHININLEDATAKRYSLRFYDPSKNEVLRVSRISKPMLILDKNNFNSRGIYSFQLFEGSSLVETGYVTIY